jgi:hypothetical protein
MYWVVSLKRMVCIEETPAYLLRELTDQLTYGRPLSHGVTSWLLHGLMHYQGNYGATLEYSLGLTGPGRRHPGEARRLSLRGHYLVKAVEAISLDPALARYPRCERLAAHVTELLKVWRQGYRHVEEPLDAWPEWKRHLFRAWRQSGSIPATGRGIYEALKKSDVPFQYRAPTLATPDNNSRSEHELVQADSGQRRYRRHN